MGAEKVGKSTLLALLAGLFTPSAGTLSVGGDASPGAEEAIRRRVALVEDPDCSIIGATVEEDSLLGLPPADAAARDAARRLAARLGLVDSEIPVHALSLGSRRKLVRRDRAP